MVRWALPIDRVAPAEPMMPAACVPLPLWALTVTLPPRVSVPPLPSRTKPCEKIFELLL